MGRLEGKTVVITGAGAGMDGMIFNHCISTYNA
jgi:NADP-dependent 3-hydroxy acid dehydrogenase YdfG